jgi:hypothetical protein
MWEMPAHAPRAEAPYRVFCASIENYGDGVYRIQRLGELDEEAHVQRIARDFFLAVSYPPYAVHIRKTGHKTAAQDGMGPQSAAGALDGTVADSSR